jgi:ribosomal protein S11
MKRTRKNLKAVVKKKKKVPLRFRKNYFLKKRLFLRFYRHEIYIRPQSNNLFLNTFFSGLSQNSYKLSAGLLHDYKKKKKKKKSYMLGLDLGSLFAQQLLLNRIRSVSLMVKGHGAQKKGVYQAFFRQGLFLSKLTDVTPCVHNGTRSSKRRRL